MLTQELVCKNSGLWEAVYHFADFHVDESMEDMFVKVVLLFDVGRANCYGHFHVFILRHWSTEVEVFYVKTCVACVWGADGAVP